MKCNPFFDMGIIIRLLVLSFMLLLPSNLILTITATSEQDKLWELDSPVLEKNSTKGEFVVQLKSSLANSLENFPIEVVFLNGTLPQHTIGSLPTSESNNTGDRMETTGLTVPSTLERISSIKNFDIFVYASNGNEIWQKVNQSSIDGRAFYDVDFGTYQGDLTILIDNIVPEFNQVGNSTDSVNFTSTISEN